MNVLRALILLLASAGVCAEEQRPLPDPIDVAIDVAIDATGRVSAAELATSVSANVAERLLSRVRAFEFTPAHAGGAAVPSRTTVWLALAFEPAAADQVAIRIRDAYTAPRWIRAESPRYPPDAVRERRGGDVVVRVKYDEHGRVTAATIERSGGADFDKAALAAMRRWRLQPEQVAGRSIAGEAIAPVAFRVFDDRTNQHLPTPKDAADAARREFDQRSRQIEGDSVVALLSEVRDTLL